MYLVSLRCNRLFTLASTYALTWHQYALRIELFLSGKARDGLFMLRVQIELEFFVMLMSMNKRHDVSNNHQFACLFNSLFRITNTPHDVRIIQYFRRIGGFTSLTLSQWPSSGNPVAIQCAWHLDPNVHWNATGEKMFLASVLPVVFQWLSSGLPIMQINTGSPLGHHWVLASASVVPVASQRTCGSSGLLVCSNYAT